MNPDPTRRRLLLAGAAGLLAGPARAARQGFGRAVTDAEGRYHFRTIRPVPARAKFWGRALAPHLQLSARRRCC